MQWNCPCMVGFAITSVFCQQAVPSFQPVVACESMSVVLTMNQGSANVARWQLVSLSLRNSGGRGPFGQCVGGDVGRSSTEILLAAGPQKNLL